ncbi:MAG: hypothetical protein J0H39_13885 [Alphaproteobacteria bacterium]|nr:hypothetical protein [Alphaproteobacteria bacterium]
MTRARRLRGLARRTLHARAEWRRAKGGVKTAKYRAYVAATAKLLRAEIKR